MPKVQSLSNIDQSWARPDKCSCPIVLIFWFVFYNNSFYPTQLYAGSVEIYTVFIHLFITNALSPLASNLRSRPQTHMSLSASEHVKNKFPIL